MTWGASGTGGLPFPAGACFRAVDLLSGTLLGPTPPVDPEASCPVRRDRS